MFHENCFFFFFQIPKDESLCDSYSRPSDKESCRIPCPSDCVLSEWSPWTECPDECDKKAQVTNRVRRRRILAFPGPCKKKIT